MAVSESGKRRSSHTSKQSNSRSLRSERGFAPAASLSIRSYRTGDRCLRKITTHLAIVTVLASTILVFITRNGNGTAQEFLPSPPNDRSLIYTLDDQNKLV